MQPIAPRRRNRAKCSYRPLQRAKMFIPPTSTGEMFIPPASTGKMFIPPDTWLSAANYAIARNATFSINLDTKSRVYLERNGGDVTRVNTPSQYWNKLLFSVSAFITPVASVFLKLLSIISDRFFSKVNRWFFISSISWSKSAFWTGSSFFFFFFSYAVDCSLLLQDQKVLNQRLQSHFEWFSSRWYMIPIFEIAELKHIPFSILKYFFQLYTL